MVRHRFARARDAATVKYLPLVWAAFRRHTTELLLTFLGLTVARRAEIERMPGVRGVGLIQGVFGFYQEPSIRVGVWTIDGGTIDAIPRAAPRPRDRPHEW